MLPLFTLLIIFIQGYQLTMKKKLSLKRMMRKAHRCIAQALADFVFLLEFLLLQSAVLASAAIVVFFFYQSFTFFLISVSCFALLYVSHFGALISYREVVKHLISEDEDPEEAESGAQSEAELINEQDPFYKRWAAKIKIKCKGCTQALKSSLRSCSKTIWKLLRKVLFFLFAIVLLDLPIWFYQVRRRKQTKLALEYKQLLGLTVGFAALFSFIPQLFVASIWMINNPHYVEMLGMPIFFIHLCINICLGLLTIGAVLGLYQLQFFKHECNIFDSLFWGLVRSMELLAKVLLSAYIFKYGEDHQTALLIVGITYLLYVLFTTLIFTCYPDRQPDKDENGENLEVTKNQKYLHNTWIFTKSLALNFYARVLYLPYKESACLQKSLTCYEEFEEEVPTQSGKPRRVKLMRKRIGLLAPQGWDNLMVLSDQERKVGMSRRAYTHTVHSMRFVEYLNLILFCVVLSIRHGTLVEYVDPEKVSLYYLGRPCSLLFFVSCLIYYIGSGIRTIHYPQNDISGKDE